MNRELIVFVDPLADDGGPPVACGRLWARTGPRIGATFEYAPSWLQHSHSFSLDPELPLSPGQFHTQRPLFRAFTDPAPDRWGQTLLRRAERSRARGEGRAPRTLTAVDFLTLVEDETRLGALRFKDAGAQPRAPFLSKSLKPVPPLIELPRLLSATDRIAKNVETEEDLAIMLAPGTSLGGARPKATVRDVEGTLAIAKFPKSDDEWPVTRWEAVALTLAQSAGIRVPPFRLHVVAKKPVLLLDRFDRLGGHRVPFMSAMTALSADDNQPHSYLEVAEALRRGGVCVRDDLHELWRRLAFNVLVSNVDDHLRNHAFLYERHHGRVGWRLAPAYDLNPTPPDVRPRVQALAIDETDATSSMELVFEVAPAFGLSSSEAVDAARAVARAVGKWRTVATRLGLGTRDLDRMQPAFDHRDLRLASA